MIVYFSMFYFGVFVSEDISLLGGIDFLSNPYLLWNFFIFSEKINMKRKQKDKKKNISVQVMQL